MLLTVSFISPKVASRAFALKRGSDFDFTKILEIINPDLKKGWNLSVTGCNKMFVSHQNSLLFNDLRTKRFRCCRWPYKTAFAKVKRSERLESEKVSDVIIRWKFFFSRKLFLIWMKDEGGGDLLLLLCDFFCTLIILLKEYCLMFMKCFLSIFWHIVSIFVVSICSLFYQWE